MSRIESKNFGENRTQITINSINDKTVKNQTVFLVFGTFGLIIAFTQILGDTKEFARYFLIGWSLLWSYFLIKIWKNLRWRKFGVEVIDINNNKLKVTATTKGKNITELIDLNQCSLTRYQYSAKPGSEFFGDPKGSISTNGLNKEIRFGYNLTPQEVDQLIQFIIQPNSSIESTLESNTDQLEKPNPKTWKIRLVAFLISTIPAFFYSWGELKEDSSEYSYFKKYGVITEVKSTFKSNWDTDYYQYEFVTENGQKVSRSGKCGDRERFNDFYKDLKVIYDPSNPERHMEYPYFKNYSLGYKIFFYLILMTTIFSFMGSAILTSLYLLLKKKSEKFP